MTDKQFEQLWELNAKGDKDSVRELLDVVFRNSYKCNISPSGELTYDIFFQQYCRYILWYMNKYSGTDEKYVPKTDKLRTIEDFFNEGMYNNEYPLSTTDTYLGLGRLPLKQLLEMEIDATKKS